jgi:hypothetical protein
MTKVTFPLKPRMAGPEVGNLQDALQLLLDRAILQASDEATRRELQRERTGQTYGRATSKLVAIFQQESHLVLAGTENEGSVDEQTADAINSILRQLGALHDGPSTEEPEYKVSGTVRFADGSPAIGFPVSAFDRDLRNEQPLRPSLTQDQPQTDKTGHYEIPYFARQFRNREKGSADIVVKVFGAQGTLLATSPILFNAPQIAELDVTIPAEALQPPALFVRIERELRPLLEGLTIEELEEDQEHQDLTFLTGETGFEKSDLARFVLAHLLVDLGIQAEFWFALLGRSFYQFAEDQSLKEQLAGVLEALPTLDADAVSKALAVGLGQGEISETFRGSTPQWIEDFLKIITSRTVRESAEPTFVKLALEHARIKEVAKQQTFARLFNEHKALTPELLAALEKDTSFAKEEIADLRTSFQLAELTHGDFSVVKLLKEEFEIREPQQIRRLAKKSQAEWVRLVEEKHGAGAIKLPVEVSDIAGQGKLPEAKIYGKMLERQFREAFPTAAFAGGLQRALQNGGIRGLRHAETLSRFLDRHESFELLSTPVDDFLKSNLQPNFRALAQEEAFRLELKAVQRVFKLAPRFEAAEALLADDLHSAQKIYRIGRSEFVRRYERQQGFSADEALLTWNRAADTHAAVLSIIGDLKSLEAESLPLALKVSDDDVSLFPNWNNLFKAGDLCECEHCRSVLSPAAYFADILMFLKDRASIKPPIVAGGIRPSAKDVLFDRRPDLGYIELNCENALTPFPYIDAVCEVLEDVVDAKDENDLVLTGFTAIPAGAVAVKAAVTQAFKDGFDDPVNDGKEKIDLGETFSLSQLKPTDPNRWVVHGENATYLLSKKATPDFFAKILRNTKGSAAELRAYPQYVNPKAYETLRAAKYPLNLPFDLFAEEVRAAFQKSNLQRWDLMRTLRGTVAPYNPTDGEIAAEYFGISSNPAAPIDEKRLILVADSSDAGQMEVWGEKGASWLDVVGNVKNFLQKTGLEYNDLLTLLDLNFINPAGDIVIHHKDPSCDTDQKLLQLLDAPKLDRIHRFLRLCRKLKSWKMWEVDLVVRHPRIGNGAIDETFLINLYHFSRLKNRLGNRVTVEQVCALFGNLNTTSIFTELFKKRGDAHYQSAFLNKRLVHPIDAAFQLDTATGNLPPGDTISAHEPAVLAALGISAADLGVLKNLTSPTAIPYINDDLTLDNLSFLWRHAWLSKSLKLKSDEWQTILKLFQQDVASFANPENAWNFVEQVDLVKASSFTPDELNWVLAADSSAKAATKETDAARFLTALRKALQAIQGEFDPGQYDYLTATPAKDTERLTVLLTSLLQKLNRDEAAAQLFVAALRDEVIQEKAIATIPAGFSFPAAITGPPENIAIRYEPVLRFSGKMTPGQQAILLSDASLASVTPHPGYKKAIDDLAKNQGSPMVNDLPAGFTFPTTITGAPHNIPIRYEPVLRLNGVLTAAQQNTLLTSPALASVTGIKEYQDAIAEFFTTPRLALKFFEPVFTAPLRRLPAIVDFKTLADPALAAKVSYDPEVRLLRFRGILSSDEKAALETLSTDIHYRNAINTIATEPKTISLPERIWLLDPDLKFPLRDLADSTKDNLALNLAKAVTRALGYLSTNLSQKAAVQQTSAHLQLSEAVTARLLRTYAVLPDTLLNHFTTFLPTTSGVVDYATLPKTFDAWFWASRLSQLLKKWNLSFDEWERVDKLTVDARLLEIKSLPLTRINPSPPIERFLRTSRLIRLHDTLPETEITLFEVLQKLQDGAYPTIAAFAADLQGVNDAWSAADVEAFLNSVDETYPTDYLLAETLERLRRALYFVDQLNAGVDTIRTFSTAAMTNKHSQTLKGLLRSKFGNETSLALITEIQDVLRERKRDALAAYLLTLPKPADAPGGKWENTNDLYAYFLLDIDMSSCQLTSRLVQGSGSVQLFVQRCFLGVERHMRVMADGPTGDSAWHWWKWMRKYRVWEANRKVYLWPENWYEPQLRKDRSSFFKDLENELQQNELNQQTVETAFVNYLEKLDGVAQLEIAGFYQEDDGDNTMIHVFGRTKGTEPHLYYYRRFDYRQWTAWEKVELDIQGDYLIPAVVNNRLFLFWPMFTEVPDENRNAEDVPIPGTGKVSAPLKKAAKRLHLQMAVSDYRQGKWTPKRISKDLDISTEYYVDIVKQKYQFFAVDRSDIDGRFAIEYKGISVDTSGSTLNNGSWLAALFGLVDISGCMGVPTKGKMPKGITFHHGLQPELASIGGNKSPLNEGYTTILSKWLESPSRSDAKNDFTLENRFATLATGFRYSPVLRETPGTFAMSPPWYLSYMDRLLLDGNFAIRRIGIWSPFFYNDTKRTFFVLPAFMDAGEAGLSSPTPGGKRYYPELRRDFHLWELFFESQVQAWLDAFIVPPLLSIRRELLERFLLEQFPPAQMPEEFVSPFTSEQIRILLKRFFMRQYRFYLGTVSLLMFQSRGFHFKNFYHPFVCDFAKLVYNPLKGIPALMSRQNQLRNSPFNFRQTYQPTANVLEPPTEKYYPTEEVDFTPDGSYSPYNWELFFHIPLLIANSLSTNQRFEEARDWYHFIFNPIGVEFGKPGGSVMSKYWITKPFFETTDPKYLSQRIENIMRMLAGDTSVPGFSAQARKDLEDQVRDWRTNPFEPHRIANYRTVAYQKAVVMKYLDNLIAWGDFLFRQESMESINEATQLYVLAAEILGPRLKKIPPRAKPPVESFNELEEQFDKFSNALVEVENLVPPLPGSGPGGPDPAPLPMLYFCIPQNDKMLGYWDTVADRLYKIRHCMNIEGVVRQLALFEPPIDPAALVKAVAGGLDINAALADLNSPLPLYRFTVLLQKANEVCNDLKALGSALLSALEKKDGEALGLLRQAQENRVLEAVKTVREKQIEEAKENLEGVKRNKELAEVKRQYYQSREFMNSGETLANALSTASTSIDTAIAVGYIMSGGLKAVPQFIIGAAGFGGSPHATAEIGGRTFGEIAEDTVQSLAAISHSLEKMASIASTVGSYERRKEEWDFQGELAVRELAQIDRQIAAAELRISIAEKELDNHILQIENAKVVNTFMHSKYTNQELYQWQIGQISGVYFQSYKLAYDLAKRAERCFRFELGLQDSSYINFGYWDSLKKGLLSGEKLQYDLRRLETAYLERNRREFELTKHISLALLDPLALVTLRETGRCFFDLPEEVFDLDYPGHYFRRIKSVSLTLPCVVGPYTTVSCTLRLLKNAIRINTASGDDGYPHNTDDQGMPADDNRFLENNIPVKAIAASSAQNDSGVFELNFRDERYLPFEGAGVISSWSLELFSDLASNNPDPTRPDFGKPLRQFPYERIPDAILQVKYSAREDAGPFKNGAVTHLREYFSEDGATPSLRMFSLRQEFPSEWHRFVNPSNPANGNVFELEMSPGIFRLMDEGKTLKVNKIWLLARCTDRGSYRVSLTAPPAVGSTVMKLDPVDKYGGLHFSEEEVSLEIPVVDPPVRWQLKMTPPRPGNLQKDPVKKIIEVEDVLLLLGYVWEP